MGSGRRGPHRQRGSVLMLVPAAVLVLFVLGAIAVDFAVAFLAQRELSNAAAAAANDAATAALSEDAFYLGARGGPGGQGPGAVEIDPQLAEEVVRRARDRRGSRGITDVETRVRTAGGQVCVTITGRVAYLFAKAVPGGPRGTTVTGRAVATAVRGGEPVRSGADVAC